MGNVNPDLKQAFEASGTRNGSNSKILSFIQTVPGNPSPFLKVKF
jgi:hypothetical protein